MARQRLREPNVAIEIELRVVHAVGAVHQRRRAMRPVGAVLGQVFIGKPRRRLHRHVVFAEDDARGLARGARLHVVELHRSLAGSARAGEIGGEFVLVRVDRAVERAVGHISAEHVQRLHHAEHGVPALFVERVLQREARRVAARAVLAHDVLHPLVGRRGVGQRGEQFVAGQLPDEILRRIEREVLAAGAGEINRALRGLEGQGLRPDVELAHRQRRENIFARRVGVDGRRDGRALGLGGNGDAAHFFAGSRFHGAVQQRVGEGGARQRDEGAGKGGRALEIAGDAHG